VSDEDPVHPIGAVLEALQEEFPDVSVSKIRFLEAQGLVSPARTASGYRQFSDADVELLRWILRQQRERYLPLKVIKARLRAGDGPGGVELEEETLEPAAPPVPPVGGAEVAAAGPAPATAPEEDLWSAPSGPPLSRSELAREAGLSEGAVAELESYGLLARGEDGYEGEAVRVAQAAAGFARYGVEARHLRMYKTSAEREATFFEQVLPVTSRSQASRQERREALADLARLGQFLRMAMLRSALGDGAGD
jgi:DNA-binding transcriptional MerR regulator